MLRLVGLFFGLLVVCVSSLAAQWPDAFPPDFIAEVEATRALYSDWGMERHVRRFGLIERRSDEELWEIDWSSQPAVRESEQRFLRSNQRFRRDTFAPKREKRIFSFDGEIARMRDSHYAQNGPLDAMALSFATQVAPVVPHSVLVDRVTGPPIGWLFDAQLAERSLKTGAVQSGITVEAIEYEGRSCWQVKWKAIRDDEGGLVSMCTVMLDRDQHLLPIHQVFLTPINRLVQDECYISLESVQESPDGSLLLPKRVHVSRAYDQDQRAVIVDFKWNGAFDQPAMFSNLDTLSPSLAKPARVAVANFQPMSLVAGGPGGTPTQPISGIKVLPRSFSVTSISIACLLLLALLPLVARTRIGKSVREWIRRRPLITGIVGVLATSGIGYMATFPPGWAEYGLTLMLAGAFGFMWIFATFVLAGERRVSIRLALFGALCAALTFSGYSMGGKRMAVRERMIREIRDGGGQVVMGVWRLDEQGLYLPRPLDRVLGEAWTGRASKAAVANDLFTADNVKNWCLDEVRWLGIGSNEPEPYTVSGHPFAKLRNKDSLWTVCVRGGSLDDTAFDELTNFSSLVDLHFDCNYQPVEERLESLDLERLWLTQPMVDETLLRLLERMTTLESVTLINPRFPKHEGRTPAAHLKNVIVEFASLDRDGLTALGGIDAKMQFANCRFRVTGTEPIVLERPQLLEFGDSDLNDQTLKLFTESPELRMIVLRNTAVSLTGLENFSATNPGVSLLLQ
ncbi:MAG: hypothetical protein AAF802_17200 [Planctomycetota bacterium]